MKIQKAEAIEILDSRGNLQLKWVWRKWRS